MPPSLAPLVLALRSLTEPLTCDALAEILGVHRATAARMEADLRAADPSASRWSGEHLAALAAWEAKELGTAVIADALRGVAPPSAGPDLESVRKVKEALAECGDAVRVMAQAIDDDDISKVEARVLEQHLPGAVRALQRVGRVARRVLEG